MNLKKIECEQFAGLLDREITFENGLNILIGENESGKSTMIELIYQLLFKNIKLNGRNKKDIQFKGCYFPVEKINGVQGDSIGGVLWFETAKGVYKIEKEWKREGGQGNSKLITPDGTRIVSEDKINEILKAELEYGEAMYGEVVFASQKRQQNMVKCILQRSSKNDNPNDIQKEFIDLVQQAVMETGGVSVDRLEKELKSRIKEYDSHWDFLADLPEKRRGLKNPWKNEKGRILEAYYRKEELAEKYEKAIAAERKLEDWHRVITEASKEKKKLQCEKDNFYKHKGALEQSLRLKDIICSQKKELSEWQNDCKEWPDIEKSLAKAESLKRKQGQAKKHDLFLKIEKIQTELETKKRELDLLCPVDEQDEETAKKLREKQIALKGRITGLNLVADIKQTGNVPIEVFSVATGSALAVMDSKISITEAVEIKVPGIMEMQLMPRGIKLDEIKKELREVEKQNTKIFNKYNINSLEDLQVKSKEYRECNFCTRELENKLETLLESESVTWKELQEENASVSENIETEKEINLQIKELYGNKSIDEYIGELCGKRRAFENKYSSIEKLKLEIKNRKDEIEKTQGKLKVVQDVPKEFQQIDDLEKYEVDITNEIESKDKQLENYRKQMSEAERSIGVLGDTSVEECLEQLSEAEADFEKEKMVYKRWKHINEIFQQSKNLMQENPMGDIEKNFRENLSVISNGGVSISSFDEKQMRAELSSGNNMLNYEILSEGTKDTISLAFRLAMLKHLFPEGGGLAVFDDPFTDMDPWRVEQSCKLLQGYAEKNQLIFITCDPKYQEMLSGNVISVAR